MDSKLTTALFNQNYVQSSSDHFLFIKHSKNSFSALSIYVDDLLLAGNDIAN